MSYSVLYYPNFQPKLEWLKSMLLVSDTVERIVPDGVNLQDPVELRDLLSALPNSLVRMAPRHEDVELGSTQLERLDRVFHYVAARLAGGAPAHHTSDGLDEMIRQQVFLHQAKASPQVRELLVKHHLIDPALQDMGELMGYGERLVLPQLASTFLLSIVAERMSERTGRDVVTDEILPASFIGMNMIASVRAGENGIVEGHLGESFVRMFIPKALNRLPLDQYLRLRAEFAELRQAFRQLVKHCAGEHDLDRRPAAGIVEDRIREAVIEYSLLYEDFRKRDVARTIKNWVPFATGVALALLKDVGLAAPLMTFGFIQAGVKIAEKSLAVRESALPRDRAFKMLVRLDKKLMNMLPVNEWL